MFCRSNKLVPSFPAWSSIPIRSGKSLVAARNKDPLAQNIGCTNLHSRPAPRRCQSSTTSNPQLLSKFPCSLAYITPCKCWKLQKRVFFNPDDPDNEKVKGSLDSITGAFEDKCFELRDQYLEIGEVNVSSDGLLHPENACES